MWGFFFPEITTRLFVNQGLRTKSYRTFTKRFSTIVKISVFVSTDMFCGKKHCFISTGFWAKIFWLSSKKYKMVFETASCVFRGRFWGKLFIVLKNKKSFLFFLVFFVNWSEDLLKQHSKCPEDLLERKKVSWKTTQSFINFPTWWGSFLDIRQTFSMRLSKLLFMCPEKLFVEKS